MVLRCQSIGAGARPQPGLPPGTQALHVRWRATRVQTLNPKLNPNQTRNPKQGEAALFADVKSKDDEGNRRFTTAARTTGVGPARLLRMDIHQVPARAGIGVWGLTLAEAGPAHRASAAGLSWGPAFAGHARQGLRGGECVVEGFTGAPLQLWFRLYPEQWACSASALDAPGWC